MRACAWGIALLSGCGGLQPLNLDTDTDVEATDESRPDSELPWPDDSPADSEPSDDSEPVTAPTPWSFAPTLDGELGEWDARTSFPTSSGGGTRAYVSWDAEHLYLAAQHPDVGSGPQHWLVVTLGDGAAGGRSGTQLNDQLPELAFPATTLLRWKSDGSWHSRLDWGGAAWGDRPLWLGTEGSAIATDGDTSVEIRLPRASLSIEDGLVVHLHWVFEGEPSSSYAATPASSFTDGDDPNLTAWLAFDLSGSAPPNQVTPSSL
jgi:hypothetical protein